jgi:GH24 family phage-related lysozyme (muramidase)
MTDDPKQQKPLSTGKQTAIGIFILAGVAIAAPIAQKYEGYVNHTYRDPANIPTYCYGETENISKDPSRIYSKDECATLLRKRMAKDYAPKILQCLPQLYDPQHSRKFVFGALIDASYNAGPGGVCRSPMAVSIKKGDWVGACNFLPTWYVTATYHGKPQSVQVMQRAGWRWTGRAWIKTFPGLVSRRNDEKKACLLAA